MAVIRVKKSKNYTTMSNFHLRDKNLSLKAKGLLSVMLSLPDNWDYSIAGLISIVQEKETAVNSALKELKKYGYLEVKKNFPTKENPKISVEYVVYEQPLENQPPENQDTGNQGVGNQGVENQGVENQGQLSTDIVNTEKQSTEEKEYFENGELNQIFLDFIADRKKRGKKMTDKAIELTVKKLKGFRSDSSRIKAITESIANGWIGIFEPAEDSPKKKYDRTANANFDGLKSGEVDF
jgi:hypothetical protein